MNTKRVRFLLVGAAIAGGSLLVSCSSSSDKADTSTTMAMKTTTTAPDTTAAPADALEITGVWARTSPAMVSRGAAYMVIANGTSEDDALLSASVDPSIAETVEVHETVAADGAGDSGSGMGAAGTPETFAGPDSMPATTVGGGATMMQMRPVDRIAIPAGQSVALKPGGYHVMLLDLKAPLKLGSKLEITLTFEKAGEVKVMADVLDAPPAP